MAERKDPAVPPQSVPCPRPGCPKELAGQAGPVSSGHTPAQHWCLGSPGSEKTAAEGNTVALIAWRPSCLGFRLREVPRPFGLSDGWPRGARPLSTPQRLSPPPLSDPELPPGEALVLRARTRTDSEPVSPAQTDSKEALVTRGHSEPGEARQQLHRWERTPRPLATVCEHGLTGLQ